MKKDNSNKLCLETVSLITQYVEPAFAHQSCAEIYDRFNQEPDLLAIPVLKELQPIGLLIRMNFLIRLADRFGRPLYSKQPVTLLMDSNPMIIKNSMKLEALNKKLVTSNQSALQEGFIVVEGENYKGVGSASTLLQANMINAEMQLVKLREARAESEAASAAKSAFLANMSHELRTPLNAVIGFSDLILQHKHEYITCSSVHEYIGDINKSGHHLLGMINTILDMSRIESGKYELIENEEEPENVVDEAIRIVSTSASSKDIQITKCFHDCMDNLLIDIQLMRQVLINLLSNAVKFSPTGSNVFVSIEQNEFDEISFVVRDEGEGIPHGKIEEMLKPFSQLDGAFVRNHEGTGLGLPLVKAYVEAHDGRFKIENGVKEGLIATVFMPSNRTIFERHQVSSMNSG